MIDGRILWMIFLCGIVTWIPRVLPFVFSRKLIFPKKIQTFLSFLPLSILTALFVQSLLEIRQGRFPGIKLTEILACIPALMVGYYTKDLMKIVVTGVVSIALLRLIL